ncbi:MAG: flippase-like domain-containing protein [Candidatus Krumholzibacteria bacterium]|nr:flippase-like domain-containing protein [Candidatus Krumholzibacteria bacterium]
MKRKLLIGIVVSGGFLFLALRDIEWDAFGAVFKDVRYWPLALCVLCTMLGHFTRSVRWKFMLGAVKQIPIGRLWSATAIAFMFNNLLPARLGEFVRAYAIGKSENISKSAAFATIVYERVVDVFTLIVLLWFCLLKIEGPEWLKRSGIILVVFNVTLLTVLFLMFRYRERFTAVLARLSRPLPSRIRDRLIWWTDSFAEGLGVLQDRKALLPVILLSIPVWGFATMGIYYCLMAIGMEFPFFASVVLIVLISLGSMIPSAPAYIGTMQYACIIGLAIFSVDKSEALAYSTLYHATQFFPITIAGLYYAWRSSIRLSDVSSKNDS